MKLSISIEVSDSVVKSILDSDAYEFHGAYIEDIDEIHNVLFLVVNHDDIDADYSVEEYEENTEAWGVHATHTITEVDVISCKFNKYDILNAEEVCAALEAFYV